MEIRFFQKVSLRHVVAVVLVRRVAGRVPGPESVPRPRHAWPPVRLRQTSQMKLRSGLAAPRAAHRRRSTQAWRQSPAHRARGDGDLGGLFAAIVASATRGRNTPRRRSLIKHAGPARPISRPYFSHCATLTTHLTRRDIARACRPRGSVFRHERGGMREADVFPPADSGVTWTISRPSRRPLTSSLAISRRLLQLPATFTHQPGEMLIALLGVGELGAQPDPLGLDHQPTE